jgi:ferritin-like metal-binding protein YciE
MAQEKTLHDAFVLEIRDIYDGERQITKALPKMIRKAASEELRSALEAHLEETRGHIQRLEDVFGQLGETVRGKHCEGIAGLLEESKGVMEEDFDESAMDACLIGAGQRVEHYEMAAYGTLVAWGRAMGHDEVADLLQQNLDEEKAADEKLSSIAEGGVNQEAADIAHPERDDDEEGEDEENEARDRKSKRPGRAAAASRR